MNNMQKFSGIDLVTAGLESVLYMIFFWILRLKSLVWYVIG